MPGTSVEKLISPPDDFESAEKFAEWVREQRELDQDFDRTNRLRGQEDARFGAGYQWDPVDKQRREDQNAPCLSYNRSFSLIRQKLASRKRLQVSPRVQPESAGPQYEAIASVREGLIRNVERISDSGALDTVVSQNQYLSGIGCYEVAVDYANADTFDYDIWLKAVRDPFAVTWDRLSIDPTGRDARHVMIETYLDIDDFKKTFPDASTESIDTDNTWLWSGQEKRTGLGTWITSKTVRVATVWRMRERQRTLVMMTNGDVEPLPEGETPETYTKMDGEGQPITVMVHPETGEHITRDAPVKYAEGYITNGVDILKGPFTLDIDRVPLVRVPGWIVPLGETTERFGLISFAKDPMRFFNFVRSDRAERIVFRPRFSFTANKEEVEGLEELWSNAHTKRGEIGIHNGPPGGGPQQVQPPSVDSASIAESEAAVQDIMDVFDIQQQAELGKTPPTASGLEMLQSISDASNVIFDELYLAAKRECYRIINQLIPYVYDTPRLIKVLGEDEKLKDALINDPLNPESVDVTIGKYSVNTDVGPSLLTRRAHSIEFLKTAINSMPEAATPLFADLIELMAIPNGDKLARNWRNHFGIRDEDEEVTPEEQAQAEMQAQIEMKQLENQLKLAELEVQKAEAEVRLREADIAMKNATADSELAQAQERRSQALGDMEVAAARVRELDARARLSEANVQKSLVDANRIANQSTQENQQ